ncbi:MAG: hypothetical protein FKY71_06585 [Spiribacter salinus]|uniref:Response regulatory domain-containing protein n=1 Tax=Spiribacter salinus TaxID=1335746 RepID=A0A540VSU9_9GAMM|nr:MAG: hypothetical protein FKY71_06585 [Spiribacter salinus]
MTEGAGTKLPRMAAVLGGAVARREFRVTFQGQAESLWVLASIGELRGSPYLSQLDLLVVDLSSDPQSKLAFVEGFNAALDAGIVALLPPGLSDLRKTALKSGVDHCLDLPACDDALKRVVNELWARVQDGRSQPESTTEAAPSAARKLAERLARVGRHSSG